MKRMITFVLAFLLLLPACFTVCFASSNGVTVVRSESTWDNIGATDMTVDEILNKMNQNSAGWHVANDEGNEEVKDELYSKNQDYTDQLKDQGYDVSFDNGSWTISKDGVTIKSSSYGNGKSDEVVYTTTDDNNGSTSSTVVGSYSDEGLGAYIGAGGTKEGAVDAYNNAAYIVTETNKYGNDFGLEKESVKDEVALAKLALGLTDSEAEDLYEQINTYKIAFEEASLRRDEAARELEAAKASGDQAAIDEAQAEYDQAEADRSAAHEGAENVRANYGYTAEPDEEIKDGGYFYSNPTNPGKIQFNVTWHTITASADKGGSISPNGNVSVVHGSNKSFTIKPKRGYVVDSITVDGVNVGAGTSYTFIHVTEDHEIEVTFKKSSNSFTIKASAGEGGAINPAGNVSVDAGGSQTFICTPDTDYEIEDVLVDKKSVGPVENYTFTDVNENHTITVSFKVKDDKFNITSSAGDGGSISPEGTTEVDKGDDQHYKITPDEGYEIEDVIVDGKSIGPDPEYTFKNVKEDHTITVTFKEKTFDIVSRAGKGGSISPAGTTKVKYNESQHYSITPKDGYIVKAVYVDGRNIGAVSSYTFPYVKENHTIYATFEPVGPDITGVKMESDTLNKDGSIKAGYGFTANVTVDAEGADSVTVTAEWDFGGGGSTPMEKVGGTYQFPENTAESKLRPAPRKVYIPKTTKDSPDGQPYQVKFTVTATYTDEEGNVTTKTDTVICEIVVKGVMYEDDFTGDNR